MNLIRLRMRPSMLRPNSLTTIPCRHFSFSWPCPRLLREIMRMSAIEKETAENVEMIWNEYHHAKPHTVSTVLNKA